MSFREPMLLLLLLLLIPWAASYVWSSRSRRRALQSFGQPKTLAPLISHSERGRVIRAIVVLCAVTLTIVALAGPRFGSRTTILHRRGLDVVIALDFSKSMLAQDVVPSRIVRAKKELERFLQGEYGDRVGVVAFAGETMEFPMTVDYSAVSLFLRELKPSDMPVGGTAIGRALIASGRLLERSAQRSGPEEAQQAAKRDQVVILLTDGEDHEGDPLEAARELSEKGVRVFAIGIGSRSGEPIPVYARDGTQTGYLKDSEGNTVVTSLTAEAEQTLQAIAEQTKGAYFRADRASVGFDSVRTEMKKLKQDEQKARRVTVHEPRYAIVLLPALLLLALEPIIPIGRRKLR